MVTFGPLDVSQFVPDDEEGIVSAALKVAFEATGDWSKAQRKGVRNRVKRLAENVKSAIQRYQDGEIDEDWLERILRAAANSFEALMLEEQYITVVARRRLRKRLFDFFSEVVKKFVGVDVAALFKLA